MSFQSWQETLVAQQASGTLFATYTTSKSVINPQALYVLPAGFWYVGRMLHIQVLGAISNLVTTPGTITFEVKLGPTANIVAFTTGAMQLNATAHTTLPFWADIMLTCQVIGSGTTAKLMGQSMVAGRMMTATAAQTDDLQGMPGLLAPATAPAQGTGFDSTVANILDFWAGFSISNAANGIQIHQYKVVSVN